MNNNKNVKKDKNIKPLSGKPDGVGESQIDYAKFFEWFNQQTGRQFKNTKSNRGIINGRLNDGYTKDDLAKVVTFMTKKWKGTEQESFLRPITLFRPSNFEGYLNDAKKAIESKTVQINQSDEIHLTANEVQRRQKEQSDRVSFDYIKKHPEALEENPEFLDEYNELKKNYPDWFTEPPEN